MLYLFLGTDDYLKSEGAKRVIDALVPKEDRDFGLETIDAACDTCADVLAALDRAGEALYTASFFGGGKVVWLRDANFLPGAKGRAVEAQDAKDAVAAFLEGLQNDPLPEGHHLVITANTCLKTTRFYKWVAKAGKVEECGTELRSWQLEKAAQERLDALLPASGLRMSPAVRAAFARRVGADSRTIVSELEKLRTYLGNAGADVSEADLEAITSAAVGAEPFDLSNALLARSPLQIAKAVALLRTDRNAAFPAAAAILNTLNDLCCLRDALDQGWLSGGRWDLPADQLPARLARLQGWMLSKQVEGAKRYTLNELRAARHYAIEMRFRLVDATSQDPWAIIEPTLLRIVSRTGVARRSPRTP